MKNKKKKFFKNNSIAILALVIAIISMLSSYYMFFYEKDEIKARIVKFVPPIFTKENSICVSVVFFNTGNQDGMILTPKMSFHFLTNNLFGSCTSMATPPFCKDESSSISLVIPPKKIVKKEYCFKCPALTNFPYNLSESIKVTLSIDAMDSKAILYQSAFDDITLTPLESGLSFDVPFKQTIMLFSSKNSKEHSWIF